MSAWVPALVAEVPRCFASRVLGKVGGGGLRDAPAHWEGYGDDGGSCRKLRGRNAVWFCACLPTNCFAYLAGAVQMMRV